MDRSKKKARALSSKTGMSYQAAHNALNKASVELIGNPETTVEQAQREVEVRRRLAEEALQGFFAAVVPVATWWLNDTVEKQVKGQYDITLRLGSARLTRLKQELVQMTADVPQLVALWLDSHPTIWGHRTNFQREGRWAGQGLRYAAKADPYVEHTHLRYTAGIADSFVGHPPVPVKDTFEKKPVEYLRNFMLNYYGYYDDAYYKPMPWDRSLNDAMDNYSKAFEAFREAEYSLRDAESAQGRHAAATLWDEA